MGERCCFEEAQSFSSWRAACGRPVSKERFVSAEAYLSCVCISSMMASVPRATLRVLGCVLAVGVFDLFDGGFLQHVQRI